MFYVLTKSDNGQYMKFSKGNKRPEGAKEYGGNINGAEITAGIKEDVVYVDSEEELERRALLLFMRHFVIKYSTYEWWTRNNARISILENVDCVATV